MELVKGLMELIYFIVKCSRLQAYKIFGTLHNQKLVDSSECIQMVYNH